MGAVRSATVIIALLSMVISVTLVIRGPNTERSLGFALASILCSVTAISMVVASAALHG